MIFIECTFTDSPPSNRTRKGLIPEGKIMKIEEAIDAFPSEKEHPNTAKTRIWLDTNIIVLVLESLEYFEKKLK